MFSPEVELEDCLRTFCMKEELTGAERYKCEHCHRRQESTKCLSIIRPPEVFYFLVSILFLSLAFRYFLSAFRFLFFAFFLRSLFAFSLVSFRDFLLLALFSLSFPFLFSYFILFSFFLSWIFMPVFGISPFPFPLFSSIILLFPCLIFHLFPGTLYSYQTVPSRWLVVLVEGIQHRQLSNERIGHSTILRTARVLCTGDSLHLLLPHRTHPTQRHNEW